MALVETDEEYEVRIIGKGLIEIESQYKYSYLHVKDILEIKKFSMGFHDRCEVTTCINAANKNLYRFTINVPARTMRLAVRQAFGMSAEEAESDLGLEDLQKLTKDD